MRQRNKTSGSNQRLQWHAPSRREWRCVYKKAESTPRLFHTSVYLWTPPSTGADPEGESAWLLSATGAVDGSIAHQLRLQKAGAEMVKTKNNVHGVPRCYAMACGGKLMGVSKPKRVCDVSGGEPIYDTDSIATTNQTQINEVGTAPASFPVDVHLPLTQQRTSPKSRGRRVFCSD